MAEKKYLSYEGLQDVAGHVNTRLKTVTTIPVSADDGAVRLYVGATTNTYTNGHIYQYDLTNTQWKDITNFSIIFTGTQAEWDNLSLAEKQAYDTCNITDDSGTNNVYTKDEVDDLLDNKVDKTTLTIKSKELSNGITIAAGAIEQVSDNTLKNKIFSGYSIYNVVNHNISVTQAYASADGIVVAIRNNGNSSITTGKITVYYAG